MKKHIFCDLDGTLLMDFRFVSEEDMEALQMPKIMVYNFNCDWTFRLRNKMLMDKYVF